jgi:hypothetical protein
MLDIMGVLYVDYDTDLFILNDFAKSQLDVHAESQSALSAWGKLLISTGGVLKPEKCFYYMVDYDWQADGSWDYCSMDESERLYVPQPDGSAKEIQQLPVNCSKKTLGIWTNPAGDCSKQLEVIHEKVDTWTNRLEVGKLPAKWAWVSYFHQLWAKIRFGLGVNASPVGDLVGQEAEGGPLRKAYRRMLPYLGVNRNIKAGWRHLPSTFGGIGLRKLLSEVVIARLNLFLQHYNTPSTLGSKLTISLQCLQLEIGSDKCPLLEPFQHLGPLATSCWCKSFWESLDHYDYDFHLDYPTIPRPREGDQLLKNIFLSTHPTPVALISLNRCRNSWNALFLSDITSANGKILHQHCLHPPTALTQLTSKFSFAEERPSAQDWLVWKEFWQQFTNDGLSLPSSLGSWTESSHITWDWYWDEHLQLVQRRYPDKIDYFLPTGTGRTRGRKTFVLTSTHRDNREPSGLPCSVNILDNQSISLLSVGPKLCNGPSDPTKLFDFLSTWGELGCGPV